MTPVGPVMEALEDGKDVLFDIDWQGTQQLVEKARADLVSVFILPPSTSELEKRLKGRAQDSSEVVANRMKRAPDEMSHYPEYDYIIVNRDVDRSIEMAMSILRAERLKRERQTGLGEFVKGLREGRYAAAITANSSTGSSSARRPPSMPDFCSSSATGTSNCDNDRRSVLRRWPNAAALTDSNNERSILGVLSALGVSRTTAESTFGGGVNARAGIRNRS